MLDGSPQAHPFGPASTAAGLQSEHNSLHVFLALLCRSVLILLGVAGS